MRTFAVDDLSVTWTYDGKARETTVTIAKDFYRVSFTRKNYWGYVSFRASIGGTLYQGFFGPRGRSYSLSRNGRVSAQRLSPVAWLFFRAAERKAGGRLELLLFPVLLSMIFVGMGLLAGGVLEVFRRGGNAFGTDADLESLRRLATNPVAGGFLVLSFLSVYGLALTDAHNLRHFYHRVEEQVHETHWKPE